MGVTTTWVSCMCFSICRQSVHCKSRGLLHMLKKTFQGAKSINNYERKILIGSIFGRTDFFADFYFRAAGFARGFCRRFFSSFLWEKSAQKKPPGKSPAKSSKIYTTKIPDTFQSAPEGAVKASCGETVVQNLKGCFWRVRFFSAPLRFVLKNI